MKVVIIGKDSYIGQHIGTRFLEASGNEVVEVDARNDLWRDFDFTRVDVVIHVAAIVHNKTINDWETYHQVNTVLPVEIARVAKAAGVKQFIFLSTMGVYGVEKKLVRNVIDAASVPSPTSLYGKSKYEAELALGELADESFTVTVVRPPNVYGKDCKGGYITGFASIVRKLPAIPSAFNNVKQSVIYIDNLVELIYRLAEGHKAGVYMPQDDKAVSAVELMSAIAAGLGVKRKQSKLLGLGACLLSWTSLAIKAYGGIEYASELSDIEGVDYRVVSFEEGIRRTVSK
ncbi:UDP-glucose 4-epimerase [Pseudobutyrivibrio sp. UC1225]|uniref:NAD-dependent epimerase/dehydratase family protein n=1 Tax=Pseudobutyrivibrio sp. UC1225 TaxID=1798185 RepID=UPI0008EBBB82|nr:NAD-dependent epimerase/dehydratase family protein [Pseudobutyrivibrio sp. UC1225]SFO21813.1 UDP-glucose 4-epimerase [Pseudobutyrivibrio sp. UC1225]